MSAAGPVNGAARPIVRVFPHVTVADAAEAAPLVRLGELVDPRAADASTATPAASAAAITNFLMLALLLGSFRYGMRRKATLFVGLVRPRGRIPGGVEGRDHLHRAVAAVLERVLEQRRQMDARAGADRLVRVVDVQHSFALEHVDHLVVDVAVVGRATRGDDAV